MIGIYEVQTPDGPNRIVADQAFMEANYQPDQYELIGPVEESPQPPVAVRIDTPLFIMRFTPQERVSFRQAAKEENEYAPLIDDWLTILNDPRLAYVELGDPNLIAAMAMMVQLGLLTQKRADTVMSP